MSEDKIYELTITQFLKQTIINWIFILGYFYVICLFIPRITLGNILGVIFMLVILGALSIPALWITINYLTYSWNRKIIISKDGITLIHKKTGKQNWIDKKRFQHIHYCTNDYGLNRLPWSFQEHLIIEIEGRPPVVITSFQANIMQIRIDSISSGIFGSAEEHINESFFQPVKLKKLKQ